MVQTCRPGWAQDRNGLTKGAQSWLDNLEAAEFRMSDGQTLRDWRASGPGKREEQAPEDEWTKHTKKVDKLSSELDDMAAKMEALLAKSEQ